MAATRDPHIEVFPASDGVSSLVRLRGANGAKLLTSELYSNRSNALRLARRLGDVTGLETFVLNEAGEVIRRIRPRLVVDVVL